MIDSIENPKLAEFYAYWDRKRAGRLAPTRADIDPVEIPHLLPNMFIYEVLLEPRDYRMVLSGTALVEAFGVDHTNCRFDEIFSGPTAPAIRAEYDNLVDTGEPVLSTHDGSWTGRDFVSYWRLLLPLSGDGETVNKLIGALYPDFGRS